MDQTSTSSPAKPLADAPASTASAGKGALVDPFGRAVTYIRVSVTDRCDFRCFYCMGEEMAFLRRKDLLSLEEIERLCAAFIRKGVQKVRLTGGEPLVRRNLMWLVRALSKHLETGALKELTMTTNGSQLTKYAGEMAACGIRRLNVSLDSLDAEKFKKITKGGHLSAVLDGIKAAQDAGMKIKINAVALKGINEDEIPDMMLWAHGQGMDMTLIETMPLGEIGGDRTAQYLPLSQIRDDLAARFHLSAIPFCSGGPARFSTVEETGGRIGFITPMSHSFCESCNRVRLTSTGTLYMCLGQEDAADLRTPLRAGLDDAALDNVITEAISRKPKGHDFKIGREDGKPALSRHMSQTGG